MCYCSDVSAYNAAVIIRALRKKEIRTDVIDFANLLKTRASERDGDTLGKKTRTDYEVSFTLTMYNSRVPGHTGDYFFLR